MNSFDVLSETTQLPKRLFLEASAGTGKTFTIEHIFARLLLESNCSLEKIVVVTFTKAATRELKSRIRSNLESIYQQQLEFPYTSNIQLTEKEKIKRALLNFDQIPIFTIHGFCHQLLIEFAFEAKVSLNLKEWDKEEIYWIVLEFLRNDVSLSPVQLQRLLKYFRYDIHRLISKLLVSNEEKTSVFLMEALEELNQQISYIREFPILDSFLDIKIHYKGLTGLHFDQQVKIVYGILKQGRLTLSDFDKLIEDSEFFLEKINTENLKVRSKNFNPPVEIERLRDCMVPVIQKARSAITIFNTLKNSWNKHRDLLSYQKEKITSDDLLKIVKKQLSQESFKQQIQNKYQALIVDEFQDTDPIQWEIFEKLFFEDPKKRVYLVGDPKQAIYAFRQADIYTFLKASQKFDVQNRAILTTNYRTKNDLIQLLNTLFCEHPWMDLPKLNQTISIPKMEAFHSGVGDLCFLLAQGELGLGKKWPNSEIEDAFLFPFIVEEIQSKKINPKQTAVIVKDRYQAFRVKTYLDQWKIPTALYRSVSLGKSMIVDLLQELLYACCMEKSYIQNILLGNFVRLSLNEISEDVISKSRCILLDLIPLLENYGFSIFIAQFLKSRFRERESVLETLFIYQDEHLYEDLLRLLPFLSFLKSPYQILHTLKTIHHKDEDARMICQPSGVQIMTVYASKGLEFETVFALGLASRSSVEQELDSSSFQELDAEKMRQLYVALTRAKSYLYIPVLKDSTNKTIELGEASPIELFLSKVPVDLSRFRTVDLNQKQFQLQPCSIEKSKDQLLLKEMGPIYNPCLIRSFSALSLPNVSFKNFEEQELPGGIETGTYIHRILEKYFNDRSNLSELILEVIQGTHLEEYHGTIMQMIEKILDLPLEGFCLRQVNYALSEMEFLFSVKGGYFKGTVDLCIEYHNKYYVIDWKTHSLSNYNSLSLEETMLEHHYFSQGRIYGTALQKYFNAYPSFSFGGVFFIFVRGPAIYHFIPEPMLCSSDL